MATFTFSLRTASREEMVDVTESVRRVVRDSGTTDGVATVFCPHTTAAVAVNENADPDVRRDAVGYLRRLIPVDAGFRHAEGNADAHIKAILTGPSVQVIVQNGDLLLGTWQGIYFCEFDGPRTREVWVHISG